jgi:hypothetical protein
VGSWDHPLGKFENPSSLMIAFGTEHGNMNEGIPNSTPELFIRLVRAGRPPPTEKSPHKARAMHKDTCLS